MTQWENLFKVRLSNVVDESMDKHDILKLLIVRKILRKYQNRNWIRVYTEQKMDGMTPDVYFEDLKNKIVVCYEIQRAITQKWKEETIKKYNEYEIPFMNSIDLIVIPLKEAPDNLSELNDWLDEYIM